MAPRKKTTKKEEAPERLIAHPREAQELLGQAEAEAQLVKAFESGRLPHAWLITGPRGIGKATLAHRFARFLLAEGARAGNGTLDVDLDAPSMRRAIGGSHTDLMVLEPESEGGEIKIEAARAVPEFLSLTPAEGKWRVVIVDPAEAMNRNAANALLKTLEEPPARAVLLLVSHNPGTLLPTIRSRCRVLKLKPLPASDFSQLLEIHAPQADSVTRNAYYRLADGSAGVALFLLEQEAISLYQALLELFPNEGKRPDWIRAHALADQLAARNDTRYFEAFGFVFSYFISGMIRLLETGEMAEMLHGEAEALSNVARLKTSAEWLAVWEAASRLMADTRRIHLDRKQVVLNIMASMQPGATLAA